MADEIRNTAPERPIDTKEDGAGKTRLSRRGVLKGAAIATMVVGGAAGITKTVSSFISVEDEISSLAHKDFVTGTQVMARCKPEFLTNKEKVQLVSNYKKDYKYYKS